LSRKLLAAVTSDVDTLESIYRGRGCRRPEGYSHAELRMGLENFSGFLEPYGLPATLFMVGNDFRYPENQGAIRAMAAAGHEIANHTMSHAQGFRLLSPEEKEAELAEMEEWCEKVTGRKPVGFRSPGWNISDDALPILRRRGYRYDSSVFPTALMPLLKFLHWRKARGRRRGERTTLGRLKYMTAPVVPYRTDSQTLARRGDSALIEFPLTVTPVLRLPFYATFLLATGLEFFRLSYRALRALRRPLQFQFHLSDFVDYDHPDLADQVPLDGEGVYVPQALHRPLSKKLPLFRKAMDVLVQDYEFKTLADWAGIL
jgi:hypothetical protein